MGNLLLKNVDLLVLDRIGITSLGELILKEGRGGVGSGAASTEGRRSRRRHGRCAMVVRGLESGQFTVEANSKLAVVLENGEEVCVVDQLLTVSEALQDEVVIQQLRRASDRVHDCINKLREVVLVEGTRDITTESLTSLDHETINVPIASGLVHLHTGQSFEQSDRCARLGSDVQFAETLNQSNLLILGSSVARSVG